MFIKSEVDVTSLLGLRSIQGMTQQFGGFLLLPRGWLGCCCGADCIAGGDPGFRYVIFLSANHESNKNIKLSEIRNTIGFCRKSL